MIKKVPIIDVNIGKVVRNIQPNNHGREWDKLYIKEAIQSIIKKQHIDARIKDKTYNSQADFAIVFFRNIHGLEIELGEKKEYKDDIWGSWHYTKNKPSRDKREAIIWDMFEENNLFEMMSEQKFVSFRNKIQKELESRKFNVIVSSVL
jgi:hypothetical protein